MDLGEGGGLLDHLLLFSIGRIEELSFLCFQSHHC